MALIVRDQIKKDKSVLPKNNSKGLPLKEEILKDKDKEKDVKND